MSCLDILPQPLHLVVDSFALILHWHHSLFGIWSCPRWKASQHFRVSFSFYQFLLHPYSLCIHIFHCVSLYCISASSYSPLSDAIAILLCFCFAAKWFTLPHIVHFFLNTRHYFHVFLCNICAPQCCYSIWHCAPCMACTSSTISIKVVFTFFFESSVALHSCQHAWGSSFVLFLNLRPAFLLCLSCALHTQSDHEWVSHTWSVS